MKKILCLFSALIVIMFSCVTASAVGETKLKLRIVSEDESQVVFSLDFVSGTPIGAMDFDVNVNTDKLKVTKIVDGAAMFNAKLQTGLAVSTSNVDKVPASVTMAIIPGFGNSNGSDMFVITAQKLTEGNVSSGDITINITNCVTDAADQIAATVVNDFGNAEGDSQQEDATPDSGEGSVAGEPDAQASAEASTTATEEQSSEKDKGASNSTVIILCAVSVVVIAGGAGAAYFFIVKKKKESN